MSKRYTEYDKSGVLGLGNVPTCWTTTRLKHVSAVQTGITLSGEGDLADPEWPYLRVANVQVGYVDLHEIKTVRVPADKAAASLLQPGDVLMTEGGDIDKLGRGALWRGEQPDMLHQNHIFAVRPSKVLDSEFLVYWLDGPVARTYFRTTAKQTTNLAGTNKWILGNLPIPMPPLKDQRAIADYLDRETARIDTLIEEQQRLIEMLRERWAALIAGKTGWGASRPDDWPMMRLSWLFRGTGSGTTPANEDITYGEGADVPWVTTSELRESLILGTARGISAGVVQRSSALRIHPAGSLLIAMYGATIGRMALLGVDATSNQACCALIGPTGVDPEFVQYSLMAAKSWLLLEAAGGGQPNINQEKIRSFRIPAPVLDEQRKIVAYLNEQTAKIDALIAEAERFIGLSRERRSALIAAAVTGQIDVREMA